MEHPRQREMWYPGCFVHLAIIVIVLTFVGWLMDGGLG
jgi:hypothetical protein